MPTTDTPLRYPGGKSQLTPLIIEILRVNDLFYGEYAEPYSGGAGIALSLLMNGYVDRIYLNDLDPAIHAFWYSVLHHNETLCQLIDTTPVTIDEWYRQKEIYTSTTDNLLEKGFATLFLNRTNRSGIIKAGVIGGINQNGKYKIDCRFTKSTLIKKIQRISLYQESISLTRLDALQFLNEVVPHTATNTLINLDPPYFNKGKELYTNAYNKEDHEELCRAVKNIERKWIVTYDDTPEIRNMYNDLPMYRNNLNYSAQTKRVGTELLIADPQLELPCSFDSMELIS